MGRPWVNPVIRTVVYLYFSAGMALLVSDGMTSAVRYQADKRFPASFLVAVFVGIFGLLAFGNWNTFRVPLSRRRRVLLCILSTFGLLELLFAPTSYGGSGA